MGENLSLRIPATVDHLREARRFVAEGALALGAPAGLSAKLDLVLEELLVNIGSYAYPDGGGDLEITCLLEPDEAGGRRMFCLRLRDWGVRHDPLSREGPDLTGGVEERAVGGLGVFLVTQMADRCFYQHRDGANEFKACFFLHPADNG